MLFPFIENLSPDQLKGYAQLMSASFMVLALVIILRELRSNNLKQNQPQKKGSPGGEKKSDGSQTEMEVIQVSNLSVTVKQYRLKPLNGYQDYSPGQFLTFHLGVDGKVARSYSLSSSPSTPGLYEVSVKLIKGGLGSTYMHQKVKVGDKLKVNYPNGRFVLKQKANSSIFVAGGIGVTPLMSMAQYCIDKGDQRPLYFFYSARTEDELVFHEELTILSRKAPNFHYIPTLTKPTDSWKGQIGRLNTDLMVQSGVDFNSAEVYTCGPTAMMDAVKVFALTQGMPEEYFHSETFTSPTSVEREKKQCTIRYKGVAYQYNDSIPILDFLKKQNLEIPFSCRAGVCGACEVTLKKGQVESLASDFLTPEDLQKGARLSCISFPETDLELE